MAKKKPRPPGKAQPAPQINPALTLLQVTQDAFSAYNRRDWAKAEQLCRRVLNAKPDYFPALNLLGIIAAQSGYTKEAADLFGLAVAAQPDNAEAHSNRGNALRELKQLDAAVASYGRAIEIKPDYAEAWNNRGLALQELKQLDAAIASYDRAIGLNPDYAEAHSHRGNTLQKLKQLDAAVASYDRAIKLKSDCAYLFGTLLHTKMRLCDWSGFEKNTEDLFAKILDNQKASPPILALTDSSVLQRKAAEIWTQNKHPANHILGAVPKHKKSDKVRIGYFSADFHNHATAYLMAGLFERHDKNKFELIAFSFGPDQRDEMRLRISAAFDRFIDVRTKSDMEVARLSRNSGIDIAVDLKGFTQDHRAGIFSCRAAPIQVSYLGYPGTMGAGYMDYLIADKTLVPEISQTNYSEKIVYLPDSYQVNDSGRKISDRIFTRSELGLPEAGFVFCCFNNNYKITPSTFNSWARIINRVEGSVLWLLEDNPTAANNLRTEAAKRGLDPQRIVFAGRMKLSEHLARHKVADLFIDTLPCNAHTTASDALWAGLPVLTRTGEAFAGRVAASLLTAIGLPELIATTEAEYEALAVQLAENKERLRQLRQRLEENRLTKPLFDTALFARRIEAAYTAMFERYQADLPPAHIKIDVV